MGFRKILTSSVRVGPHGVCQEPNTVSVGFFLTVIDTLIIIDLKRLITDPCLVVRHGVN